MGRFTRAISGIVKMLPLIAGVLLLVSLILNYLSPADYARIFTGDMVTDPLIGAAIGSISAGNPITSYIIGGELIKVGVGLLPIIAFILCWVTVGIIQAPAEVLTLGKGFTIARNVLNFILAIVIAILATQTLGML